MYKNKSLFNLKLAINALFCLCKLGVGKLRSLLYVNCSSQLHVSERVIVQMMQIKQPHKSIIIRAGMKYRRIIPVSTCHHSDQRVMNI